MKSEKDLLQRANNWLAKMRVDKFPIGEKVGVVMDKTQKTCFATCQRIRKDGSFIIHLMPALREMDGDIVDNTIIHEIIHTCPGCWNHGNEFHRLGRKATLKYNLKYPIDTKGDSFQSNELAKTEIYFKKSKLYAVDLESGRIIRSFRSNGTKTHRVINMIMNGLMYANGKWMILKEEGQVLPEPRFSPKVTEEDKRNFNEKFASQGRSCYPILMPAVKSTVKTKTRPEIVVTAVVPKPERVAAKKEKTIVIHTGTAQLSLF